MDILKLLTYEEKIGGLAIFDSRLEMTVLDFDQKKGRLSIVSKASVDLPKGVIAGGLLKNETAFVAALKSIISVSKKLSSFVVSLPANCVYSHSFAFSNILTERQIEDAMRLNLRFSLPMEEKDAYVDWETIESREPSKKEVLLCAGNRAEIDKYLAAFAKLNIAPVAIEFHALSAGRILSLKSKEPSLVAILSDNNLEAGIFEFGALRFLQSFDLNKASLDEEEIIEAVFIDKIWRIKNFYDAEKNTKDFINHLYLIGDAGKTDMYQELLPQKIRESLIEAARFGDIFPQITPAEQKSNLAGIAFGAALRGLMPREEDTIISLMPIGTEEAYERRRMVSFIKFASDLVSVLSVFFAAVFVGVWVLMGVLFSNIENSLQRQGELPSGLLDLKNKAMIFNETIKQADSLNKELPKLSQFAERVSAFQTVGVTLTRTDISSAGGVTLGGVAGTRDSLLQFKNVLDASGLFREVKIPLNYLEQKINISFSFPLELKNVDFMF